MKGCKICSRWPNTFIKDGIRYCKSVGVDDDYEYFTASTEHEFNRDELAMGWQKECPFFVESVLAKLVERLEK